MTKKLLSLTVALFGMVFGLNCYSQIFVNGYGNPTCGQAISDVEGVQGNAYKAIYLAWLHGYLTSKRDGLLNENMQRILIQGDTLLGEKISNETLTQLWIAKCRKEENIPKTFYYIAVEIYTDLKNKKY